MRYAKKRVYRWGAAIAYSVGLMASDGNLSKDGRHLDLTSVDLEQLHNFSKAVGKTIPISNKMSGAGQPAYRMQMSDVAYYDFLTKAGLTPAKSKTMGPLNIPDKYYADFLRGLFDGDGTTYAYWDNRWRSSYMFYVGFTSASPSFVRYLQETNRRLVGVSNGSIRQSARAQNLMYAKSDSYQLRRFMYYNDTVVALTRKREKLASFAKQDAAGIILAKREW